MESAMAMTLHALIIGAVLYAVMRLLLRQSHSVAETRSLLLASLSLAYMLIWGHKAPSAKINPLLKI